MSKPHREYGIFGNDTSENFIHGVVNARPQQMIIESEYNNREYGTKGYSGYRYPEFNQAITEHMDLMDTNTRKICLNLNEEGQSTVLTSLTSRLYDNIVSKVDDIDYGDIPSSKGDITKLSNYPKIIECIQLLRDLLTEYKQDTSPVDEVATAISNVETRKDLFGRAYRYNSELPMIVYCNTVLSVIASVSYLIATTVEFIKTPKDDTFKITLDKISYTKSKDYMLFDCLKKFNASCKNGSLDKSLEAILQSKIKNLAGELALGIGGTMVVIGGLLLVIIPFLRDMVFIFYYTRMRVSEFFDLQADLLQLNAYNLESNQDMDKEEKSKIVLKQMKIVEFFRKTANVFSISAKKAEVETDKEYRKSADTKYKIDEVIDEIPGGTSALF